MVATFRRPGQLGDAIPDPPGGMLPSVAPCTASSFRRPGDGVAFAPPARQAGIVTADQLEMISTDPRVMHGQALIAGTRVPVSMILDCLAAGMTAKEITAEYPAVTVAGVHAAAAYGTALARGELPPAPEPQ